MYNNISSNVQNCAQECSFSREQTFKEQIKNRLIGNNNEQAVRSFNNLVSNNYFNFIKNKLLTQEGVQINEQMEKNIINIYKEIINDSNFIEEIKGYMTYMSRIIDEEGIFNMYYKALKDSIKEYNKRILLIKEIFATYNNNIDNFTLSDEQIENSYQLLKDKISVDYTVFQKQISDNLPNFKKPNRIKGLTNDLLTKNLNFIKTIIRTITKFNEKQIDDVINLYKSNLNATQEISNIVSNRSMSVYSLLYEYFDVLQGSIIRYEDQKKIIKQQKLKQKRAFQYTMVILFAVYLYYQYN